MLLSAIERLHAIVRRMCSLTPSSSPSGNFPRSSSEKSMGVEKNPLNKPRVCYQKIVTYNPRRGDCYTILPFEQHYYPPTEVTPIVTVVYSDGDFETKDTFYHLIKLYNDIG